MEHSTSHITVKGSGNVRRIISIDGSELGAVHYMGTRINRWEASWYDTNTSCYFPINNSYADLDSAISAVLEEQR